MGTLCLNSDNSLTYKGSSSIAKLSYKTGTDWGSPEIGGKMVKRVLVPVDFSLRSEKAAKEAMKLFPDCEGFNFLYVLPLRYIDVIDTEGVDKAEKMKEESEKKINDFVNSLNIGGSREVKCFVEGGDPAGAILKIANGGEIDAVVMGHRCHTVTEDFIIGSVTHKVISKANVPVVVVK